MRKEMIVALMEHLAQLTNKDKQPVVRHIDLWNEQVEFIEQESPFDTPAVFIELRPMRWSTLGGNIQQCNADLRFHIVTRWEGSSANGSMFQKESLERFDILDSIDSHLSRWCFNSPQTSVSMMQRIGSSTNHNHEELVEDISDFTCLVHQVI